MKALRTGLGFFSAAVAIAAVPSIAGAEAIVPPGNSAATQYTEAIPTAGGPKATGESKHPHRRSPNEVLGTRNAERLNSQGPQGRAAAEVAAATAPSTTVTTAPEPGAESQPSDAPNGAGREGSQNSGSSAGELANRGNAPATNPARSRDPGGSSALGEVASQVTGTSSSGGTGILLPLAIVGAIAWSIAYLVRQRKRAAG